MCGKTQKNKHQLKIVLIVAGEKSVISFASKILGLKIIHFSRFPALSSMGSPGGFKAHGTGHPSMAPPFAMMMSNLLSPGGGGGGRHHFGGVRPPSPTPPPPQSPQQMKGGSSPSPGTTH